MVGLPLKHGLTSDSILHHGVGVQGLRVDDPFVVESVEEAAFCRCPLKQVLRHTAQLAAEPVVKGLRVHRVFARPQPQHRKQLLPRSSKRAWKAMWPARPGKHAGSC